MNIVEIIKKAPKDHVYWCTLIGECRVVRIDDNDYPIRIEGENDMLHLTKSGHY